MIGSGRQLTVAMTMALGLSPLGCSGPAPGGSTSDPGQPQIVGPVAVAEAPELKERKDYDVVSDLPAKMNGRVAIWRGMVSPSEAFADLSTQSATVDMTPTPIVLLNIHSRRVKKIAELPGETQLVGMDFSKDYIVWTDTTSFDAYSQPWTLRSYDRRTGKVRVLASSDELGVDHPPLLPPYGVVPRLTAGQVYLLAAASNRLPLTAHAYRVSLSGRGHLKRVAPDVQGIFPQGKRLLLIRDGEFFSRSARSEPERPVDPRRRGSERCAGTASVGVVVECDTYKGKPRLTILQARKVVEIRFPQPDPNSMNYGVGYLNCSASWVTFSFNDHAYVYNLRNGKLGTLKGAQYTAANPSWGRTIAYHETNFSPGSNPTEFIRLRR